MRPGYLSILFFLSGGLRTEFLVDGHITNTKSPAGIPDGSAGFLPSMDAQAESLSSNRTSVPVIINKPWMQHGISVREAASDDVGIPNHHDQAGSLAIYSIPEPPPPAKKQASKYWDPVIFYCTILILSSTLVTVCLLKNCLCPALKDDCKMLPCYDCCCS